MFLAPIEVYCKSVVNSKNLSFNFKKDILNFLQYRKKKSFINYCDRIQCLLPYK